MGAALELPDIPQKKTGSIVELQKKTQENVHAIIGMDLKKTRESLAISLPVAAQETNILEHYIAALEKGDWSLLPGEVYARGYLKKYTEYLDLDSAAILKKITTPAPIHQPIRHGNMRTHHQPVNLVPFFVVGGLLLAAFLLAFLFKNMGSSDGRQSLVQPVPQSLQDYSQLNDSPFYSYSCFESTDDVYGCYFSQYQKASLDPIPYIGVN